MKKLFSTLVFLSLFINSSAQIAADYGFNNQFNAGGENSDDFVWNDGKFITKYVNGFLELKYTEDQSIFISEWADINWKKPFTIKTALKLESGDETKAHGILFGGSGIDNCYVFTISGNGMYTFYKYEKDVYKEIKAWTESPAILTGKRTNVIELKSENNVLNFFVNGTLTYTHQTMPFYGFVHGYLIMGPTVVHSDYYEISQKQTEKLNLIDNPGSFGQKVKLSANINSEQNELCPVISYDERTLYVARVKASHYENSEYDDDIWYSELNVKDSTWGPLKNIGKPLNNKSNNFAQYVSPDNNTLIVGNHYNSAGQYSGPGYSYSHRTEHGWSLPKPMAIKNYYNKSSYTEVSLAPNGKVMIVSAWRDETQGFKDFYVSFLNADSSWSEPKNIGNVVNTYADEMSPFIAADGVTMYFATPGHPGYGGNDLFVTRRLDNTWTNWSKPKNLGPKINSKKGEAYYVMPASGKTAYMVERDGNNDNIYAIKQAESARPEPVVLVKGVVYNSETKLPMAANINYSELGSKQITGHVTSDPKTGAFMLALPKGKKYSLTAIKQHFLAVHESVDLVDLKAFKEQEINLYLTPIKKGEKVVLNNLFFKANTADILPESHDELDKIVELLKVNRNLKVEVSGHTSKNNSKPEWNLNLSTNRANAVKAYFVEKGINEARIIAIGYGNTKPILLGMDEATLAKNRRVELEILEN
jgi:OmpA-OmpF porin, OOP family